MFLYRLVSLAGFVLFLLAAWGMSEDRKRVNWRILAWGCGLQWILALVVLKVPYGNAPFDWLGKGVEALIRASDGGAAFLFGRLTTDFTLMAAVAFHVLPIVIFISAVSALLYHWGIVQKVIKGMAWLMQRTMRISGLEALGSALFVFFGIETVTSIKGYMKDSTRSEMFTLMTAFMATIAGSVMGAYVAFGADPKHLITASLMSAPAAVVIAKLMIPEKATPVTTGVIKYEPEIESTNSVDALSQGATAGLKLALNIGACLIAFVGMVALINMILWGAFHSTLGWNVTLERIFGYVMSPFAVLMGVPWGEATTVGELLGTKTVINEFVAYQSFQGMVQSGALSERAQTISVYALCGFANFGSVAILVGGISTLAPGRRSEIARLGLKALVGGTLAAFLTACVAGTLG